MNPLVNLVLASERDPEAHWREHWLENDKVKFSKIPPQPKVLFGIWV